jgi:hypothetical protein
MGDVLKVIGIVLYSLCFALFHSLSILIFVFGWDYSGLIVFLPIQQVWTGVTQRATLGLYFFF